MTAGSAVLDAIERKKFSVTLSGALGGLPPKELADNILIVKRDKCETVKRRTPWRNSG